MFIQFHVAISHGSEKKTIFALVFTSNPRLMMILDPSIYPHLVNEQSRLTAKSVHEKSISPMCLDVPMSDDDVLGLTSVKRVLHHKKCCLLRQRSDYQTELYT